MASYSIQRSSSSSSHHYDVFVSFRGKDTRYSFIDNLFAAFQRKGIVAFRDDANLKKGKSIAPELLQAIEGSHVLIVVFSKNYASSTWCLRELAKMLDCLQVSGKCVLPVFYDVDPSEVRKQSGEYEKAFQKHEERFKEDIEKRDEVQRWRKALTRVANLAGWDIRNNPQNAEIEKIVLQIISILGRKLLSLPNDDLNGLESPLEEVEKLVFLGSDDDVRVVGIRGMGGIGKTTLARILYGKLYHQFRVHCFVDDVSKIYRDSGAIGLQKEFLCQTLKEENLQIWNVFEGSNMVRTRLCHEKALIVLDNVDKLEQLEKLAVYRGCLGAGSRVIIISRDEHILRAHKVDDVYNVHLLNYDEACQLFCKKAFEFDYIIRGYGDLINEALSYANGLPLALKVLGSLFYDRDVVEWRSALDRLREKPDRDIMDVLRLSFDSLEEMEKEIFLHIACLFHPISKVDIVKKLLLYRGFHSDIGIRVLADKSLITIVDNCIVMHDLFAELGRKIVQNEGRRKWTRLRYHSDFENVWENMEKNVEVIVLDSNPTKLMVESL